MTLIIRPDMRKYQLFDFLMEFKYVSLGENNLSGEQARSMAREEICSLKPVRFKLRETKKSLAVYALELKKAHGEALRLKVFSIVTIGFERLVWEITDA